MMPDGSAIKAIARGALIEVSRRRDPAVAALFLLALAALLGTARLVGVEHESAAAFLLNLALTLVIGLAHLITLLMAARQFPDELENRTLYPLLARPVARRDVVLGKWVAAFGAGAGLFAGATLVVLLLAPPVAGCDPSTLFQLFWLQFPALATTAAVAILLSLLLPRAPAVLVTAAIVFGTGLLRRFVGDNWMLLIPEPGRINLAVRYTDGIAPLTGTSLIALTLAGILWTALALAAAAAAFQRRHL